MRAAIHFFLELQGAAIKEHLIDHKNIVPTVKRKKFFSLFVKGLFISHRRTTHILSITTTRFFLFISSLLSIIAL